LRFFFQAFLRGAQFLLDVVGNGGSMLQQAWAQQYSMDALPAWARIFEPAAISSKSTVDAIHCLKMAYDRTVNLSWLTPVPAAVGWLTDTSTTLEWTENDVQITGWARLYELQTNRPIYGLPNGGPKEKTPYTYNYEEARPGYAYRGDFGIPGLLQQINAWNATIPGFVVDIPEQFLSSPENNWQEAVLKEDYFTTLNNSLSETGLWIGSDGLIRIETFINNFWWLYSYIGL